MHRGLVLEDVQSGASQVSRLERSDQCRLVDDGSACGVHEQGAALHPQQLGGADQMARLRIQRAVDGKDVGVLQELVEGHAAAPGGEEDTHSESFRAPRHRAPDAAIAQDAERPAAELAPEKHGRRPAAEVA